MTYLGVAGEIDKILEKYFCAHNDSSHLSGVYEKVIKEVEMVLIKRTLNFTNGNKTKAAEILGLHRNTFAKKLALYP